MSPSAEIAEPQQQVPRLVVRPLGIDDFSALRYLHAKGLIAQTADAVSDAQAEALIRLIYSPEYSDMVMDHMVLGAWLDGELVGSAAWQTGREGGAVVRIGPVFVRHPRFGIGSRLLGDVEAEARASGFRRFTAWATSDAVPFYARHGYQLTSHGTRTFAPGCTLRVAFLRKDVA